MSRILPATCSPASVVTAEGVPVAGAVIMSQGKQQSSGFLVIDGDKFYYVTSNASDIKTTIEKMAAIVTKISTMFTSVGAGMTGPTTAPPPTLVADVLDLTMKVTELNVLKEALK